MADTVTCQNYILKGEIQLTLLWGIFPILKGTLKSNLLPNMKHVSEYFDMSMFNFKLFKTLLKKQKNKRKNENCFAEKSNKFLSSDTKCGFGHILHRSSLKLNAFLVKNGSFCLFSFVAYCENKVHRSKKAGSHQRIQRIEGGCLLLSNHMHRG